MNGPKFKFFLASCLVIFCVNGCFFSPKETFFPESERARFKDFFNRFLFLEGGVYTLYGSKPVTEFILTPQTPEEKIALQEAALKRLSKEELAHLKASSFEYEEEYWFEETWKMWEEKLKTLPIKRYLFVERKVGIPSYLQENRYVYFINIGETAKILHKHYSLFREYVGFDFDPLSVVFDAKNSNSPFWNAIWGREITDKSVCLIGILFGYGLENSYPFSWQFMQRKSSEETTFVEVFLRKRKPTVSVEALKQFNPPHNFFLPAYMSFSLVDPQTEQYKCEYDKIRDIYLHSDIIECTMQQLLN